MPHRKPKEPDLPQTGERVLSLLDDLDRALADLRTLLAHETKDPDE